MSVEKMLNDPENSYLLYLPGEDKRLLIAAPHHAPLGIQALPCESHPTSDENTGWIAYQLSSSLNCGCLIAGNYFLDPNKHKTTDYYKIIESLKPKILVEIHAHGSGAANFDIEISCGSRDKSDLSQQLAEQLTHVFSNYNELKNYQISGDFDLIHFRATKSLTINTEEWTAYHIELPQKLRGNENQYLIFCEELGALLRKLL